MNELNYLSAYGSFCIETGNYYDAVDTFNRALILLKEIFWQRDLARSGSPQGTECGGCSSDSDLATSTNVKYYIIPNDGNSIPPSTLVFRNPLMIPQRHASDEQLSFVILYNLALSHYLCAIHEGGVDQTLYKTLQLWGLVYKLHYEKDLGLSTLHTCAILNNLGNVYKALGQVERCQRCFNGLLTAMIFLKETGHADCLNEDETFFHSVSQLILKDCRLAPAA
jgi:tetratricopeptide (TPR) repeat protein